MTTQGKELTFWEAAAIVAGYGIGGGIMAVPYLASLSGVLPFLVIMGVAYFISLLLHLMIVEMMLRDDETEQMVELLGKYLFRGRFGPFFTWSFFILCVVAFFGTLAAYMVGGGEIINEISGLPIWAGELIFYAMAAGVVFFGLKAVGISEKAAVAVIALVVVSLTAFSLRLPLNYDYPSFGGAKKALALYGMVMFSFFSFFSIPQAVHGMRSNKRKAAWAVVAGIGITFVFTLTVTLVAMGVCSEVTRIAMVGWGKAIGGWALILGSLFVLLAMLTSFWSISLALSVVLRERMQWPEKLCWAVSTLPCLLVALIGFTDFLGFLRLTGGFIAILAAIIMVPAYLGSKKHGLVKEPAWTMGPLGHPVFLSLVIIGFIFVLIGSMVSID